MLIEELTVYQNLLYTARLCFARLTDEEIGQRVEKVLKELDLEEIKGLEVGSLFVRRLVEVSESV